MSRTLRWLAAAFCLTGIGINSAHAQRSITRPVATQSILGGPIGSAVAAPMDDNLIGSMAGGCDDPGCACGSPDPCGCSPKQKCSWLWGNVEYLLWWTKESGSPPLITTSPADTIRDDAGVIGQPTTSVLFGGDQGEQTDGSSGGRITLGVWLEPGQSAGLFARAFALEDTEIGFSGQTNGDTILARPFFNALTGEQDALLLGFPGEIAGNVDASFKNRTAGIQALVRRMYRSGCNYRLDFVYGYRYMNVEESLRVDNFLEFIDPDVGTFGNTIQQFDLFDIENEFHGGEFGIMGHSVDGRFTMDFLLTVALGSMRERASISGATITTPLNGDPFTANGGLLTQASNIGNFDDDRFAVIPEVTASVGYFITPRLDLSVGYTFLYASRVMRAGDAVDLDVNLNQQAGGGDPSVPVFRFDDTGYWVQGLNVGLNFRY